MRSQAQKVLDVMMEILLTTHKNGTDYTKCSREDIAKMCRISLEQVGIHTVPMGMSWAVIIEPRDQAKCTTCKFVGEKYWDADADSDDEAGYACTWPGKELPESLKWANRERVIVNPTCAAKCSCYELDTKKWEIVEAERPE